MIPMIYDAVCSGTPRVMHGNWDSLSMKGWRWDTNLGLDSQDGNLEYLRDLQIAFGRENVAVGFPFVVGEGPRSHEIESVGIYLRQTKSIVDASQDWPDTFPEEWVLSGAA